MAQRTAIACRRLRKVRARMHGGVAIVRWGRLSRNRTSGPHVRSRNKCSNHVLVLPPIVLSTIVSPRPLVGRLVAPMQGTQARTVGADAQSTRAEHGSRSELAAPSRRPLSDDEIVRR